MRDLKFWQDKYETVAREVRSLSQTVRHNEMMYRNWIKPYKLKTQYGHALNRDYDGYKVYVRRKAWLKKMGTYLTKSGTARREAKRLETTKLSFYEKKIVELGGTVPDQWR